MLLLVVSGDKGAENSFNEGHLLFGTGRDAAAEICAPSYIFHIDLSGGETMPMRSPVFARSTRRAPGHRSPPSSSQAPNSSRSMIVCAAPDRPAGALAARRWLMPTDAFYEWRAWPDGKQPYAITRADGAPIAFAGLWEGWRDPAGETLRTFAILTPAANDDMARLHDRMPMILEPADCQLGWARSPKSTQIRSTRCCPGTPGSNRTYGKAGRLRSNLHQSRFARRGKPVAALGAPWR